jgi:hypothetical protein
VGADLPDEPDVPPDGQPDRRDDQAGDGGRSARGSGAKAETRSRQECYDDLRAAEAANKAARARQATADEQGAWEKWQKDKEESCSMWSEYQRKWPPGERPQVDRSEDKPGTWRGEGNRKLDATANSQVEAACDQIANRERDMITPAMRAIESQDPDRHLVGLKHCRKGRDRIKEKVADGINFLKRSPEDAVSLVSDTIRYTLERYSKPHVIEKKKRPRAASNAFS